MKTKRIKPCLHRSPRKKAYTDSISLGLSIETEFSGKEFDWIENCIGDIHTYTWFEFKVLRYGCVNNNCLATYLKIIIFLEINSLVAMN